MFSLAIIALRPKPGVTRENFDRLRTGMSEQEVESILGCPGEFFGCMTFCTYKSWDGQDCWIVVRFSQLIGVGAEEGSCSTPDGIQVAMREATWIDRECRWLAKITTMVRRRPIVPLSLMVWLVAVFSVAAIALRPKPSVTRDNCEPIGEQDRIITGAASQHRKTWL
jgi:hypothetical protein